MIKKSFTKVLAFLTILALLFPTTVTNAADGDTVSVGGVELVVGRAYAVPLNLHNAEGSITNPYTVFGNVTTNRFHLNDNALVRVKTNNTVEVKLQLHSYDAIDAFQIIKPEKVQDAIDQYDDQNNSANALFHDNLKMASFTHTGAEFPSGIDAGLADSAFNDWWLPSSAIRFTQSQADAELHTAYIAFDMPLANLNLPLPIKSYASVNNIRNSVVGKFDVSNKKIMPGKIPEGDYQFSFYGTNFASGTGTAHPRNSDSYKSSVAKTLSDSSIVSASVGAAGQITVTATASLDAGNATVAAINIPLERDILFSGANATGILSEYYNITTSAAALDLTTVSEDGKTAKIAFEIGSSYEDFAFGKPVAFIYVNKTTGNLSHYRMFLHLIPNGEFDDTADVPVYPDEPIDGGASSGPEEPEDEEGVLVSNGLKLKPTAGNPFPEDAVFTATETKSTDQLTRLYAKNPWLFVNDLKQVLDDTHYRAYSVTLTDKEGRPLEQSGAYLEFALPQGWNLSRLQVLFTSGSAPNMATLQYNYDKGTVGILIKDNVITDKINADFLFLDRAPFLNPQTAITENGLYKARTVALNADTELLSMANYVFWGDTYIECKDGAYKLYTAIEPTYMFGYDNPDYMGNMHLYPGSRLNTTPVVAEPLAYYTIGDTNRAGNSDDLFRPPNDSDGIYIFLKRGAFDLGAPYSGNYYWARFDVPTMDGLLGGEGLGSRDARLGFISFEKVDGPNPLAAYDKSLLLARIESVERSLAGDALLAGARTLLGNAVSAARTVYNASPSSEQVKATVDALAAAVTEAEEYDPSLLDKSALLLLIAQAKDIPSGGYTTFSFAALQAALASAEAAANDNTAKRDLIDARAAALQTAMDNLVPKDTTEKEGIADGSYSLANKTRLWNYSQNQASMGDAAVDHGKSFVVISENGTKGELHLFFRAMTFSGLTGHLLEISNLVNPVVVDGILEEYDLIPARIESYLDETDEYLPAGSRYPYEVVISVTPGVQYTPVFVNVPVMAGFEDQPARVLADWSGIGAAPPADDTPSVSKIADKSESVAANVTVTDNTAGGGGKIAVSTVEESVVTNAASNLADTARQEATAAGKNANEIVVAEIKIEAKAADASGVTETVIEIPKTAVAAIVAEAGKSEAESRNVEIVLTVESALASGTASVTLDALTLAQLANTAAESDTVSVVLKADASATLTDAQSGAVPEGKVPFSVEIAIGDTRVTEFAREIAVAIPYVKQGGEDKKVVLWYVPADGQKAQVGNAVYNAGTLTFVTDRI